MKRLSRTIAFAALLTNSLAAPGWAGAEPDYDRVYAGHYQAILGDCMGCHTAPGGRAFAGGAPLQTPFGLLATPNITPDAATGIGAWSEEDFRRAVKQGISPGGKRLYPAMPYPAYARMSDEDVGRLWSYMQTVEPVPRAVQANSLRFPYNMRSLMAIWNWLYFKPTPPKSDPSKSAAWNRGADIVTGPGHCGTCHTPKTFLGAETAAALTGASLQGWFAPDITANAKRGVGSWSVDDVVTYLKTGHNAHSMASGPMAEAIENSTSRMTDGDLKAIAVYLKDVPASAADGDNSVAVGDPHRTAGSAIYRDNCEACHGADGKGENAIFPPLADNPIVRQSSAETLARVVLAGTQAAQTEKAPTGPAMPSFAWRLSDEQVADVLTYVRSNWGGAAPVSAGTVGQIRKGLNRP
jgi:mono/diheme cytochrome c family protein